jgi:hypothetical protein
MFMIIVFVFAVKEIVKFIQKGIEYMRLHMGRNEKNGEMCPAPHAAHGSQD